MCLVVPCFDEASRLREAQFSRLVSDSRVSLVFVDDGSRDDTRGVLERFASAHPGTAVVVLDDNLGKAEAVRRGLLRARQAGTDWVGYVDADLATPVSEILRLVDLASQRPDLTVVMGSRLALLGRDMERSPFRHYAGRIFATGASITLGKAVYDTQCGAKLIRNGTALERAITAPFRSRWAFDVELLGRLDRAGVAPDEFWEEPLETWSDQPDSKRTLRSAVRATLELVLICRDLDRWEST